MKKSISAILVAALMLFAFTACEQQPLIPSVTQVRAITGITGPDYLLGQTFDASDFTVEVEYTDGSKASLNGSGIVRLADEFPAVEGPYDVIATIGSSSAGSYSNAATATATGTFNVYAVSSIAIATQPTVVSFEEGTELSKSDLAGIVVTATYGKSKTMDLDASEIRIAGITSADATSVAGTTTVPEYVKPTEENPDADKALVWVSTTQGMTSSGNVYATYEIKVTEEDSEPVEYGDITSISVALAKEDTDKDGEINYGEDSADNDVTVYYGDKISEVIVVTATDGTNTWVLDSSDYYLQNTAGLTNQMNTLDAVTFYATLKADDSIQDSTGLEVTPENYIVSIASITPNPVTEVERNTLLDDTFKGKLTVTGKLAADENGNEEGGDTDTITEYSFTRPALTGTGASEQFTVVYENAKGERLTFNGTARFVTEG